VIQLTKPILKEKINTNYSPRVELLDEKINKRERERESYIEFLT
jgi:hypothetical protein